MHEALPRLRPPWFASQYHDDQVAKPSFSQIWC